MLQPSEPGYDFTVADLQRANVSPEQVGRILMQSKQTGEIDPSVLLAAIFKSQKKFNSHFAPLGWALAAFNQIQLFTENQLRNYLIIQNVGTGDLLLVFEAGSPSIQDFSAAADQQQLINKQQRALRIVAGGYYEPLIPPINPITIFTLNASTDGVAIEGMAL